jgi:hypothetical protein
MNVRITLLRAMSNVAEKLKGEFRRYRRVSGYVSACAFALLRGRVQSVIDWKEEKDRLKL